VIDHHQGTVIVGHGPQQADTHMTHPPEGRQAGQGEPVPVIAAKTQGWQIKVGQGKSAPCRQIVQRIKEIDKGHAAKAQQPPQPFQRRVGDKEYPQILQDGLARKVQLARRGGQHLVRQPVIVDQHRLE
jgi:hypothetical protein